VCEHERVGRLASLVGVTAHLAVKPLLAIVQLVLNREAKAAGKEGRIGSGKLGGRREESGRE
jgi:hypothetical protein